MGIKLLYFPLPGRAEPIRLILTAGKVAFEDVKVAGPEWPAIKPTTPFGQMPCMEVDGVMFAQSAAILTYAAKVAGFYPEDPLEAAKADQVVQFLEEINGLFGPSRSIQDKAEQKAARAAVAAGPFKEKAKMLEKLIDGQLYVAGDKLSHGDFALFCGLCNLKTGFLDGFPVDYLDEYPILKDYRNHIASIDFVKERYAAAEGHAAAFKADA